jgi:hypothetical protein
VLFAPVLVLHAFSLLCPFVFLIPLPAFVACPFPFPVVAWRCGVAPFRAHCIAIASCSFADFGVERSVDTSSLKGAADVEQRFLALLAQAQSLPRSDESKETGKIDTSSSAKKQ